MEWWAWDRQLEMTNTRYGWHSSNGRFIFWCQLSTQRTVSICWTILSRECTAWVPVSWKLRMKLYIRTDVTLYKVSNYESTKKPVGFLILVVLFTSCPNIYNISFTCFDNIWRFNPMFDMKILGNFLHFRYKSGWGTGSVGKGIYSPNIRTWFQTIISTESVARELDPVTLELEGGDRSRQQA